MLKPCCCVGALRCVIRSQDAQLDADEAAVKRCSLSGLWQRTGPTTQRLSQLTRGENSLGGLLEAKGVAAVPSPTTPCPSGLYFNGAFTTAYYGHKLGDSEVVTTQVEPPIRYRQDEEAVEEFAEAFAASVAVFLKTHLSLAL